MTLRSRIGWLLCSAGFLGNLLPSCEPVDGCENTGSCPGGGTAGSSSGAAGRGGGGGSGTASGGAGGLLGLGGGGRGAQAGTVGEAGSGGAHQAGEAGAPSTTGGTAGASQAGAPSDAGAGGNPPCDGACGGSTPRCDRTSDLCVECLGEEDCSAKAPACEPISKQCVACLTDEHCGLAAPACDVETHSCVACTEDDHCPSATPLCNVESQTCVACLKATDCTSATASRCDAGTCKPCSASSDCSQIAGKGICDVGECVQCTTANEAPCAGKSCDPANRGCTATAVGSLALCQPCIADSECMGGNLADADARCIPMQFQGTALPGGFCLRRTSKTCSRPYATAVSSISLSRAPLESYCGINQAITTCAAMFDLTSARTCLSGLASDCGCLRDANGVCKAPGQGGLCQTVGTLAARCTYPCGTPDQCRIGTTCTDAAPYCH